MGRGRKRRYLKKRRAQTEERTRRAITEAVMELHRTVGPAHTTITEVAERAGVSRMTVYKHFPSDADLIGACATHWASLNPFPDPARWARVADPEVRLSVALEELYSWYHRTEDMMGKVLRDAPLVPALDALMRKRWWRYIDSVVDTLMAGRGAPVGRRRPLRAALRLALDFRSWRTLTSTGLSDATAARIAAALPGAAATDAGSTGSA